MSKSFGFQVLQQKQLQDPKTSFTGKNVIVTGATSGLGFEAAVKFVALDASRVILTARDLQKGNAAKRAIEERTGRIGRTEVWELDMDSYRSIREFADRAKGNDSLDVAVLNAGVYMVNFRKSAYGWEETLKVNTLSTVLLALLLLPKLRIRGTGGDPAILEIVTSRRAEAVVVPPEQLHGNALQAFNDEGLFKSSFQYRLSKFFTMCTIKRLSSMVDRSEVVVTAVCPGAVASNLSREWNGIFANMLKSILSALILRTAEQGARTYVGGASLGFEAHGRFWYDDELHGLLTGSEQDVLVKEVWQAVIEALGKDVPEAAEYAQALERTVSTVDSSV